MSLKIKMKKSSIVKIVLIILLVLFILNTLYHIFYFRLFQQNTENISEEQRQKAIEILNKNIITNYELESGIIIPSENQEIVRVKIKIENQTNFYTLDLISGEILKTQ